MKLLFSSNIYLVISCLQHRYKEKYMCILWLHIKSTRHVYVPHIEWGLKIMDLSPNTTDMVPDIGSIVLI